MQKLFLGLLIAVAINLAHSQTPPKWTTTWGSYDTTYLQAASPNDVVKILGLRYAEKPERFQKAKAMGSAKQFALKANRVCPQEPWGKIEKPDMDEDCLTMDIYKPTKHSVNLVPPPNVPGATNTTINILVLFPSLTFTTGGCKDINLAKTAIDHNVVAICIQSRLGVFGFSVFENKTTYNGTTEVKNTNIGFDDQDIALKFIHENRASLGGVNATITLVGAGAGAAAIHYRLLLKDEKVADRAIIIDGSLNNYFTMPTYFAAKHTIQLARKLKCKAGTEESCLKEITAHTIASKLADFPWGPTWNIAKAREYKNPWFMSTALKKIPVIVGMSSKAGAREVIYRNSKWHTLNVAEVATTMNNVTNFKAAMSRQWPKIPVWNGVPASDKLISILSAYYYPFNKPGDNSLLVDGIINSVSDYGNSIHMLAYNLDKSRVNKTYYFYYEAVSAAPFSELPYPSWAQPSLGSYLPVMFGMKAYTAAPEKNISERLVTILKDFYHTGVPKAPFALYTQPKQEVLLLSNTGKVEMIAEGKRVRQAAFWKTVAKQLAVYPEPPTPAPEPEYGALVAILVGIAIVVVIGVIVGVFLSRNHKKSIVRRRKELNMETGTM